MAKWWLSEPWRLVQTNLREIDADLDPEKLVHDVKSLNGNVLLFNVGGIQANYPTKLKYHFRNPYLQNDLVGEVLRECKKHNIRFIGRFDFSKANELYLPEHPDWFYRSISGEFVNYNGQVHTCVNGYYQREYSLEILREALEQYDMDAVFFNMFGYQTRDYSGNYHGICQCDNCRRAFAEYCGRELPIREDWKDPVFREYVDFQRKTVNEMLDRIADLVKSFGEDIGVCTYATHRVDIVRSESNSAVDRPLPHFPYNASDNTKLVTSSWPDKTPSNSSVHFVDIPYRHVGVSPHLTALRLAQTIAAGGGPDYYVIGTLDRQNDRSVMPSVKALFDFHEKNEKQYQGLRPSAKVALMAFNRGSQEYCGIYRALAESHVLFNVFDPDVLNERPDALEQYTLVILPGTVDLAPPVGKLLDEYVYGGGKLLVTQEASVVSRGDTDHRMLGSLGVERLNFRAEETRSAYLEIRKDDFPDLDDLDLSFLDGPFRYCHLAPSAKGFMRLVPPCMYGPPEKCYYKQIVDVPGLVINKYGTGTAAYLPWNIGALYNRHSWPGHRRVLLSIIKHMLQFENPLESNAPDCVEFTLLTPAGRWQVAEDHWVLNLVNISGQVGVANFAPIPVNDIDIRLKVPKEPKGVDSLGGGRVSWAYDEQGLLRISLSRLELLESLVIKW